MSNRNKKSSSKIVAIKPKEGFTKEEKSTLFMALAQIIMNEDRILRNLDINTSGEETFYDDMDSMVVANCTKLIEEYNPSMSQIQEEQEEKLEDASEDDETDS